MTEQKQSYLKKILSEISGQEPYSLLPSHVLSNLFEDACVKRVDIGQVILRPDELPANIYLVLQGEVRLLGKSASNNRPITLEKRGPGQLLGWVSLLRGGACEWVSASESSLLLSISAEHFVQAAFTSEEFLSFFSTLPSLSESYSIALKAAELSPQRKENWSDNILTRAIQAHACVVDSSCSFIPPRDAPEKLEWFISTPGINSLPVGSRIYENHVVPSEGSTKILLPIRCIGFLPDKSLPQVLPKNNSIPLLVDSPQPLSLSTLGIVEEDQRTDDDRFPSSKGIGPLNEALAVCEMVCLFSNVPFRKDTIKKVLDQHFERDKELSLEIIAGLCELLGFGTQLSEVSTKFVGSVDYPSVFVYEGVPVVLFGARGESLIIAHPHHGLIHEPIASFIKKNENTLRFVSPKISDTTPQSRFGWNWFTPLLSKYRRSLVLVFVASLLAQLFGLAIPLLIQQIIDKVLNQGNLSSLNVLGITMIFMALFQGVLTALRTYIFVDTTDRMDLILGSSVIDRLLSLPLPFFEKRTVGELSQRLGELSTIRQFLTGTALTSVLSIIFSALYLIVMLVYSPLLTAVALSTLPLYFILVFGVAPLYKSLIRKRAIASARTQSHLIEVVGGIQTVKAQHFELTSRWKWQDRYKNFVNEGFKSVALGATAGEIGKFLNQVSGLLVLWVGMWLVLKGEFTLGMLIAFRIISSNVTGPLLQLATLYQGFQGVQLAMERLSDVVDQIPELSTQGEIGQIALPTVQGNIRFENVSFRFNKSGPYQVDNVSMTISKGSYVGIVGESGSGKSTLMKLLARLYQVEKGRISVDDYDISKIDLASLRRQIGIVPQDSLLFEGTIAENIALNDPNASTESIIEAAKIACAHEFIMELGLGYATPVAERGSNLSGGQRQRIAIARTILANPRLLVMDEATSALDYNTERQLCLNLQEWSQDRTVFFITHRLSTIQNSDLIVLMHNGVMTESGTHEELMQLQSRYAALYRQQNA